MDPILVREVETHERCECHLCTTLQEPPCCQRGGRVRPLFSDTLLLTFTQAAELLRTAEATVRELVYETFETWIGGKP